MFLIANATTKFYRLKRFNWNVSAQSQKIIPQQ